MATLRANMIVAPIGLLSLALLSPPSPANAQTWPNPDWPLGTADEFSADGLSQAIKYAESAGGSGMIVHRGKLIRQWGDPDRRYDVKSATKSIGTIALGLAIADGKVKLDDLAVKHHPDFGRLPASNLKTEWLDKITLRHLATQTAGFEKPGGYKTLLFEPGTRWHYSDGGPNWLAECVTLVYKQDIEELLFQRAFTRMGLDRDDIRWRKNQYREAQISGVARREFGAGVHADVDALARIGYLFLREGKWKGEVVVPKTFVYLAVGAQRELQGLTEWDDQHGDASQHYGLLWWNNVDGALSRVPRDAYWAWGLYDSLIVVIPSLDLVVVRGGAPGKSWPRPGGWAHYGVLEPFLDPIVKPLVDAARTDDPRPESRSESRSAPYPASSAITKVEWAPVNSIVRFAKGSDNWPVTWGDDDRLYTAYGDGWGFEPRVPQKLSLGLATVAGPATEPQGQNLRAATAEQRGDGAKGPKASGMLMVDGVLYMLTRNVKNSQLSWSLDRGRTWQRTSWKFTESFGCPTFLQFGRNYAGARDEFVYVYSPDAQSAYQAANRMVLARVPRDRLRDREAFEFFSGTSNAPGWSAKIGDRTAIFSHPKCCYRSGVSYCEPLQRYLWYQVLPQSSDSRGPRFEGGMGLYDSPTPWGPWTTVDFATKWDVGPGESGTFPTKWMTNDGRLALVFSGDDAFSVRELKLGRE